MTDVPPRSATPEPRPSLEEVKRQNVAEFLERQAMQREHPERLILADALGDMLQYEYPDKYAMAFGLLSRLSAQGVSVARSAPQSEPEGLDVERLERAMRVSLDMYGWDLDVMAQEIAAEYARLTGEERP